MTNTEYNPQNIETFNSPYDGSTVIGEGSRVPVTYFIPGNNFREGNVPQTLSGNGYLAIIQSIVPAANVSYLQVNAQIVFASERNDPSPHRIAEVKCEVRERLIKDPVTIDRAVSN